MLTPGYIPGDPGGLDGRHRVLRYVWERDSSSISNYERLFAGVLDVFEDSNQPESFRRTILDCHEAFRYCIKQPLTTWPVTDASYLLGLTALGPVVDVFTLNYDVLIEEECRRAGVPCTTGFDSQGLWSPDLFAQAISGIRLWKLHGSLSWVSTASRIIEVRDRAEWKDRHGVIILGPRKGLSDEPRDQVYRPLRDEYLRRLSQADTCLVVGFGFGETDSHIGDRIVEFAIGGGRVIEVNPDQSAPPRLQSTPGYRYIRDTARAALDALTLSRLRQ